jgi:hypothetical protein
MNNIIGKYGDLPTVVGKINVEFKEMMFYQYLPIKMLYTDVIIEIRHRFLVSLIEEILNDFIKAFGRETYEESYVYLTVKHQYVSPNSNYNRPGWHADGFMSNDINYIWSDSIPTVFNTSNFDLPMDDIKSIDCMNDQARKENNFTYDDCTILRLNQYNIHRVGDVKQLCLRSFVKISISKDKYDLKGNSINYGFDYDWTTRPRELHRNIPQSIK